MFWKNERLKAVGKGSGLCSIKSLYTGYVLFSTGQYQFSIVPFQKGFSILEIGIQG